VIESRIVGRNLYLGEESSELAARENRGEFTLEPIAKHALGLSSEHVEREIREFGRRSILRRQDSNLGTIAVGDHNIMCAREVGDRRRRIADSLTLLSDALRSPTRRQRVAAQGDD
jgi:hypothetical protein